MFNGVIFGNLGKDWEVRTTPQGKKVASNSMAIRQGKDKTLWVSLVCWNEKSIDTLAQYTGKGVAIVINGRVDLRTWEPKDGKLGAQIEVTVDGFALAGKKEEKTVDSDDVPWG